MLIESFLQFWSISSSGVVKILTKPTRYLPVDVVQGRCGKRGKAPLLGTNYM